jgi:hypothetical protein
MNDSPSDSNPGCVLLIDVDGVVITGELHEAGNIFRPNNIVARGTVADFPLIETA